MRVTILISSRNNAGRLDLTLAGMTQLRIPAGVDWELVVADNGSSDGTAEVMKKWVGALPLKPVWEPLAGVSRARNTALAQATGDLVIFTDDDVTVPSNWVEDYVGAFQRHGDRYFYGGPIASELESELPNDGWLRIAPASVRGLDWGSAERTLNKGEYFTGANWACSTAAARAEGGFDIRMGPGGTGGPPGGEENDLMDRIAGRGREGYYLPSTRITHWVPTEKTRPEHFLARWQTYATVMAWKRRTWYGRIRVARIPWRLYPEFAKGLVRSAAARVGLGDRVDAETRLAWCKGVWAGFRLPPP